MRYLGLSHAMSPVADKLTPIRDACDIDLVEEAAWAYCSQYIATPALLYASLEAARVMTIPGYTDWYTLKARTSDNDLRTELPRVDKPLRPGAAQAR
jgi:hypothetical protein